VHEHRHRVVVRLTDQPQELRDLLAPLGPSRAEKLLDVRGGRRARGHRASESDGRDVVSSFKPNSRLRASGKEDEQSEGSRMWKCSLKQMSSEEKKAF
jgi:sirohydrochlorin ferrochelatase